MLIKLDKFYLSGSLEIFQTVIKSSLFMHHSLIIKKGTDLLQFDWGLDKLLWPVLVLFLHCFLHNFSSSKGYGLGT